jgi:hypothetical protein
MVRTGRGKSKGTERLRPGNAVGQHASSSLKSPCDSFGLSTETSIDGELFAMVGECCLKLAYLAAA